MPSLGPRPNLNFNSSLGSAYLQSGSSSFSDFVAQIDGTKNQLGVRDGHQSGMSQASLDIPHGTTIVATTYEQGVVMAGDRRATSGNVISQRDIEKVFTSDDNSIVGIAGAAGVALELVRLFQVELEHYEKMEGVELSLDGKASRLSTLLRGNLGMAMHGLAVVPMFAGLDTRDSKGRIFSYDVTGGRYEERDFHAIGSGSSFARGSLKKLYNSEASKSEAITTCIEALYDAADDDSATGGPDMTRRIFPIVVAVDAWGSEFVDSEEIGMLVQNVVDRRFSSPDGPRAIIDSKGKSS